HGKTTTTAMIAMVLEECGYHPTVLVGGEVIDLPGNAKLGRGEYLVAETDESDGSFLKLKPSIAVVTNIDDDHLDHYGTLASIREAFAQYLDGVPPDGHCVLCADDEHLRQLAAGRRWPVTWYSLHHPAHWQAGDVRQAGWRLSFSAYRDGRWVGDVELGVIGEHNVANALAALAVAEAVGIPSTRAAEALARFRGVSRRMERVGQARGIWVVDDFAHHPTEVRASLDTVARTTTGRVICIFQPHRYSRTRQLFHDFGKAFRAAHHVLLADIYAGPGELPEPGIDAGLIARALEAGGKAVTWLPDRTALVEAACRMAHPGDVIMTVGAGDVGLLGQELLERLAR
ncbi:MAG TPA: UDP-N-acetylmuramate--L-alanine ligase, partial [Clostridiales bacterium UBA8153]|nr:UDP-N-acetylmuramate--L-alanine ligase [Clostridiales bacterium UBA8153]